MTTPDNRHRFTPSDLERMIKDVKIIRDYVTQSMSGEELDTAAICAICSLEGLIYRLQQSHQDYIKWNPIPFDPQSGARQFAKDIADTRAILKRFEIEPKN